MSSAAREPKRRTLAPGTLVGRYEIESVLGDGASGVVYRARCVAPPVASEHEAPGESAATARGQEVALKLLHAHLIRDRQIRSRFHREGRILKRLRGEHLVELLDFGELPDGQLFMALALVSGEPLDVLCKRSRMDVSRAVDIARQICAALGTAHAAGVVHRDLKPGNVIVEQREGRDCVHVLDFGMAKVLRGSVSQSLTALTEQNMVFGTPEYMAPEQARGEEVDARADVYATGVLLYELITGAVPFAGETPINIMTAHLTQDPPPPSSKTGPEGVTPALEAVILHALSKHPDERYPSAEALSRALSHAVEHPADVHSTAPPPPDFGSRDTELAIGYAPTLRFKTAPAVVRRKPEEAVSARLWVIIAIVAALGGILAGVALSFLAR